MGTLKVNAIKDLSGRSLLQRVPLARAEFINERPDGGLGVGKLDYLYFPITGDYDIYECRCQLMYSDATARRWLTMVVSEDNRSTWRNTAGSYSYAAEGGNASGYNVNTTSGSASLIYVSGGRAATGSPSFTEVNFKLVRPQDATYTQIMGDAVTYAYVGLSNKNYSRSSFQATVISTSPVTDVALNFEAASSITYAAGTIFGSNFG